MKPIVKVKCENCGTEFNYRKRKRFCSNSCKVEGWFKQKTNKAVQAAEKKLSGTFQEIISGIDKVFKGHINFKCNDCGVEYGFVFDGHNEAGIEAEFYWCLDCQSDNVSVVSVSADLTDEEQKELEAEHLKGLKNVKEWDLSRLGKIKPPDLSGIGKP